MSCLRGQRVSTAWAACLHSVGSVSLQRGPGGATEHRPACVSTPQRAYCHHRVWTIAISTQPRGRRLRRMLYVAPAVIHVVVPCGESLDSWRSRAARWARGSHDPSVCIIKADLPSVPYIEASNRSRSTPTAQSSSIATSPGFPSSRSCLQLLSRAHFYLEPRTHAFSQWRPRSSRMPKTGTWMHPLRLRFYSVLIQTRQQQQQQQQQRRRGMRPSRVGQLKINAVQI